MDKVELKHKEEKEILFWKENEFESSSTFTTENRLNKLNEAKQFIYKVNKYEKLIKGKKNVLELGSGQGWASCVLKKNYLSNATFTVTDISEFALESLKYWEEEYDVKIENSEAVKSYELSKHFNDKFDLIFCYSAAHHFVLIEETIQEINRILTDDGICLFLSEPTSSALIQPMIKFYLNKMPHSTPEDVLIPSKIRTYCHKIGLHYLNYYDPIRVIRRSRNSIIYFNFLNKFKFLQSFLPSSSDLLFYKNESVIK